MNPEQPAHGEVKVSVTIPRELFDFLMGVGEIDGTSFGDLNDNLPGRFWWRSLMRACERATPPATDVALREKLGVCSSTIRSHERKGNLEGLPGIVAVAQVLEDLSAPTPPDQPTIGERLNELLQAALPYVCWVHANAGCDATSSDAKSLIDEIETAIAQHARAAIAAMPKEDIWEEAARFAHEIADGMRFVGDTDEGRIRHEGLVAGARFVADALRDRRA